MIRRDDSTTRSFVILVLAACLLSGCMRAEPRWLLRMLPGEYPEVVYYVPTDVPAVALTIDDGPDPETTPALLDVLAEHDVRATFFVVTDNIPGNEALIKRVLSEGHELGHHMSVDEVSVRLSPEEFARKFDDADRVLDEFGGSQWFRAGSGRYNKRIRQHAVDAGYRIAMASSPPVDTLVRDPDWVSGYFRRMVEPGSIIVLHDVGDRGRRAAEALADLVPKLKTNGYAVMTLTALDRLATDR